MSELIEMRPLVPGDLLETTGVVARGMRDNPGHVAIFGGDPARRLERLRRFFGALLPWIQAEGEITGAWRGGELVAVLGMPPQGRCFPSLSRRARMAPSLVRGARPRELRRGARWLWEWERRDPREPHQHIGPVAVDAPLQGRGISSQLMHAFTTRMNDAATVAYLETDKLDNVRFYQRFGFETIDEAVITACPTGSCCVGHGRPCDRRRAIAARNRRWENAYVSDRFVFPDGSEYAVVSSPAHPEREPLVMEFVLQPRCLAPLPHGHPRAQREIFEVLEGAFELRNGRSWHRLEAGQALTIGPGEVHTFRNHETVPARVCNVHDPAYSFERYIRRLHTLVSERGFPRVGPRAALYFAVLVDEHRDTEVPAAPLRLPIALLAKIGRTLRLQVPH